MSPDDERHGTVAGHSAHMRDDRDPCQPCRTAATEARKERRKVNPGTPRPSRARSPRITPFLTEGYDPDDGLTGGRWMRKDGSPTLVWVQIKPVPEPVRPERKPDYPDPPQALVACPVCKALVNERCRTRAGDTRENHSKRLVSRSCACGERVRPGATYCESCAELAKRRNWREAKRRARVAKEDREDEVA